MTDLQTVFDLSNTPDFAVVTVGTPELYNAQLEEIAAGLVSNGVCMRDIDCIYRPNVPKPDTTIRVNGVVRYRVVLDASTAD